MLVLTATEDGVSFHRRYLQERRPYYLPITMLVLTATEDGVSFHRRYLQERHWGQQCP